MAQTLMVDGPWWVASGLDESAGLYPLRVESAVSRLVGRLLPGVNTITTGARYFSLHALAWADAEDRGLDAAEATVFVRRCEVVIAAASFAHAASSRHERRVPSAHGEDAIPRFLDDKGLNVAAAAALNGLSKGGFSGVYEASERTMRLVSAANPPGRGERADLHALGAGLGLVLELAREDHISQERLSAITDLCPCRGATAPDGAWLRRVMLEQADPDIEGDRNRQVTVRLMIDALDAEPQADVERAFRLAHGFGPPIQSGDAAILCGWRAAILRNYSVTAWRNLWRWISQELSGDAMTAAELADRLADAIGPGSITELISELPTRVEGHDLTTAEEEVRNEPGDVPRRSLRQLALGAQRLNDLDDVTRPLFIGSDQEDLGPIWVQHQLEQHSSQADLARDLVHVMLRRARRVALSKMQLGAQGRPYVPTRLRDRDGLLSMVGQESDGEVSLRGWTLVAVLCGLGVLERDEHNVASVTDLGRQLRGHLG